MKKFSEFEMKRPDAESVLEQIQVLREKMDKAQSYQEFKEAFDQLEDLQIEWNSMAQIAYIRHTIDTRDKFYKDESEFFDHNEPRLRNELTKTWKVVLDSPFVNELKKEVPETWFMAAEFAQKSVSDAIVEDLQEENKLASRYQELCASAQIPFHGETLTLAQLDKYMHSLKRSLREEATKAYWNWFAENERELAEIYDQMVKVRDRMAKKMGFENYIPLGYLRMQRFDYNQEDVANYRKMVLEDVVPVCTELFRKQAERLNNPDGLRVWDEKVLFPDGVATPKYPMDELVKRALKMYQELSSETGEFFQQMVDRELMDLNAKPGKAGGGYCTMITSEKAPFIFSNANGTQSDIETLTHEAGHAFQAYSSADIRPSSCIWPTSESAEIDSMSMEFLTWPWMKNFFEEDTDRYYYTHLAGSVTFIPYGITVDHFQHEVYAHPEWSHEQRMQAWRNLEKQYLPHKNYEGIDVLERGGWWMRQLHIFLDPFYYVDYTLAQVLALQNWNRLQKKDPDVLKDYISLCKAGGTLPFRKLVALDHLQDPFEKGCLKQTMDTVSEWFETHPVC